MAMSGIRDMSVINEAPQDRHPVQTYVLEYDEALITEAIRKELARGGQVYYLHNRAIAKITEDHSVAYKKYKLINIISF